MLTDGPLVTGPEHLVADPADKRRCFGMAIPGCGETYSQAPGVAETAPHGRNVTRAAHSMCALTRAASSVPEIRYPHSLVQEFVLTCGSVRFVASGFVSESGPRGSSTVSLQSRRDMCPSMATRLACGTEDLFGGKSFRRLDTPSRRESGETQSLVLNPFGQDCWQGDSRRRALPSVRGCYRIRRCRWRMPRAAEFTDHGHTFVIVSRETDGQAPDALLSSCCFLLGAKGRRRLPRCAAGSASTCRCFDRRGPTLPSRSPCLRTLAPVGLGRARTVRLATSRHVHDVVIEQGAALNLHSNFSCRSQRASGANVSRET